MKWPALFILCLFISACQKELQGDTGMMLPQLRLQSDSIHLVLASASGNNDSFNISSNISWKITIVPATASWIKTSVVSGTGNLEIYVSVTGENKGDSIRKASIIISPVSAASVTSVTIPVMQNVPRVIRNVYGGTDADQFASVIATRDGGFIGVGYTESKNGDVNAGRGQEDAWVVKADSTGKLLWQKSFGGSGRDFANAIADTKDGGYIISGHTTSSDGDITNNQGGEDAWIMKIDENGRLIWSKTFGGTGSEVAASIVSTADGGYVFTGFSTSNNGDITVNQGGADIWVVKIDALGTRLWQKSFGGTGADISKAVIAASYEGLLIAGTTQSNDGDVTGNHGYEDGWILKLDRSGNKVWQRAFGGTGADGFYSIATSTDGGFVLAGISDSNDGTVTGNHGATDAWLVKIDAGGNMVWQKTYGGTSSDYAFTIIKTGTGYLAAGLTNSNDGNVSGNHGNADGWALLVDAGGSMIWQKFLGGSGNDAIASVTARNTGSYVLAGTTDSNNGDVTGFHGFLDAWLMKF